MNSKYVKYINVRAETIKFLKENMGINLHKLGFGNGFLDIALKRNKRKIDKLHFIKI